MSTSTPAINPTRTEDDAGAAGAGAAVAGVAAGAVYAGRAAVADVDVDAGGVYAGRAAVADVDATGGGFDGAAAGRGVRLCAASGAIPAGGDPATIVVPHCTQNFAPGWVS
jgi:hypothetical protein